MNRFKPREGTQAPYWRHMDYIAESMDQALRAALADYIALSPDFFIQGAVITSTPSGTSTLHSITAGHVCYKGEVMPVDAHSVLQTASQVVYIEVLDVGVDVAPVLNNDGQTDYVLRRRSARMRTASVYPAQYMSLTAPRKVELDRLRFKGRLTPKFGIVPYVGPMDDFSATGLGLGAMEGWAVCNGLNGTPDLRGMALFGATNIPSSGAPTPYGGLAGNTDVGDRVGADLVSIGVDNLPPHKHSINFPSQQYYRPGGPGSNAFVAGPAHPGVDFPDQTEANTTAHEPLDVRQSSHAIVWLMSIV